MRAAYWWIDRWLKSTAYADLTLEEQGAYRNLLDQLWLRGGVLPNDDRVLGKCCGDALAWPRIRDRVLARFTLTPEGWRNETHDEVSASSDRYLEAQAAKGRKRAEAAPRVAGRFTSRHQPEHQPDVQPTAPAHGPAAHQPPGPGPGLQSSSSSSSKPQTRATPGTSAFPDYGPRAPDSGGALLARRVEEERARVAELEGVLAAGGTLTDRNVAALAFSRSWLAKMAPSAPAGRANGAAAR